MTEHLYDRDNPKSVLRGQSTGVEGLFYGVPNINERAEMIARALSKQTDGDLTKFVMQSQKPRDNGQKWRVFKNIARFMKNPYAFYYWKTSPFVSQNRVRFLWVLLISQLYLSTVSYAGVKQKKEGMVEKWMHSMGMLTSTYGLPNQGQRFPADRHKNYIRYSNFHQKLRNKSLSFIWTDWWCRDQNFRKYFEMRKKNGIRPSQSGFYHEKIYSDGIAHQRALHAKRQMRDLSAE